MTRRDGLERTGFIRVVRPDTTPCFASRSAPHTSVARFAYADPSDPLFHKASWHNPKTMAHVPNTDYETNTEAMSNWVPPEHQWRKGKPTEFKREHKNYYKRAHRHSDRTDTARAPSPIYSVPSSAGSIQYAPQASPVPDNFRNTRSGLLRSQSSSWVAE